MKQNWEKKENFFKSSLSGNELHQTFYFKKLLDKPKNSTKTVLMVVHGLGEHFGRYAHFPDFLSSSVDVISGFDHLGHGRSQGRRGHIDSFDRYVEDVNLAFLNLEKTLKTPLQEMKIHLLGHSMGGLISLLFLAKNNSIPILSASISAPLLGIQLEVPPLKKMFAQLLVKVWGSLPIKSALNAQSLTHDTQAVKAYKEDPLVHSYVTPLFFQELQKTLALIKLSSPEFSIPIQFLIPLQDQIVNPLAAIQFFDRITAPKKRLQKYIEFYHEGFNEVGKEKIFQDLKDWIQFSEAGVSS